MGSGGRRRTTWTKGTAPRSKGRPKGAKDQYPRGFVKDLVLGAIEKGKKEAHNTLLGNLKKTERVKETLELGAKLNREIGVEAIAAPPGVTIIFNSRGLDPEDFRRRALARDAGNPDVEALGE